MTVVETALLAQGRPSEEVATPAPAPQGDDEQSPPVTGAPSVLRSPSRLALLALVAAAFVLVGTLVVVYGLGSVTYNRDQRSLLATERGEIDNAAAANEGLYRPELPTLPPRRGSVVGILVVPVLGLQVAVVEGTGPGQTAAGVGHEPGTAGLGQPGNSALVGRSTGYGAPFGDLDQLRTGDKIVTATTEGQSVYVVKSVKTVTLVTPGTPTTATTTTTLAPETIQGERHASTPVSTNTHVLSTSTLFDSSTHNLLTLVTSAQGTPWNTTSGVVVVADLHGEPYEATPQESRTVSLQGNLGDPSELPWIILGLIAVIGVLIGAVELYRRMSLRAAYLLSTAPLIVVTFLTAEAASRLLPAWL